MSEYIPIQCALHDSYELACMRNLIDSVVWRDDDGHVPRKKLRFLTISIKNSEEFLVAADQEANQFRIRLDHIESTPPGYQES